MLLLHTHFYPAIEFIAALAWSTNSNNYFPNPAQGVKSTSTFKCFRRKPRFLIKNKGIVGIGCNWGGKFSNDMLSYDINNVRKAMYPVIFGVKGGFLTPWRAAPIPSSAVDPTQSKSFSVTFAKFLAVCWLRKDGRLWALLLASSYLIWFGVSMRRNGIEGLAILFRPQIGHTIAYLAQKRLNKDPWITSSFSKTKIYPKLFFQNLKIVRTCFDDHVVNLVMFP